MKKRIASAISQGMLIVLMLVLVTTMLFQVNALQGTARVINYAGIVRGATQREIKLEIVERPNDDLIAYLDEILNGLKNGGGKFELVRLEDETYQHDLDLLLAHWKLLKQEIQKVRQLGYEQTAVVELSEQYFRLADNTVSAAEEYSQSIATRIKHLEFISSLDLIFLIAIVLIRSVKFVGMRRQNSQLAQKAFTDQATGLPNKGRCEEFFTNTELMNKPIACIVFDLNNLKTTNDTLGHSVGDQLIGNFARLLRNAVPTPHFVGRYGGDEFMAVIYDATGQSVRQILEQVRADVAEFNRLHHGSGEFVEVSYACGWAVSADYPDCSFRVLFDAADKGMYRNKMAGRKQRT